jgi:hypothetical protein
MKRDNIRVEEEDMDYIILAHITDKCALLLT